VNIPLGVNVPPIKNLMEVITMTKQTILEAITNGFIIKRTEILDGGEVIDTKLKSAWKSLTSSKFKSSDDFKDYQRRCNAFTVLLQEYFNDYSDDESKSETAVSKKTLRKALQDISNSLVNQGLGIESGTSVSVGETRTILRSIPVSSQHVNYIIHNTQVLRNHVDNDEGGEHGEIGVNKVQALIEKGFHYAVTGKTFPASLLSKATNKRIADLGTLTTITSDATMPITPEQAVTPEQTITPEQAITPEQPVAPEKAADVA
jgi:hypothetical protein